MHKLINFQIFGDDRGSLVSLESFKNIPFEIKRSYYIFRTSPNISRGMHAHKNLKASSNFFSRKLRNIS